MTAITSSSPLFPYTTLFRSLYLAQFCYQVAVTSKVPAVQKQYTERASSFFKKWLAATPKPPADISRSEEHTSELQSRGHLVCRLLLEKKNAAIYPRRRYCCL